jgi:hypothetical protein
MRRRPRRAQTRFLVGAHHLHMADGTGLFDALIESRKRCQTHPDVLETHVGEAHGPNRVPDFETVFDRPVVAGQHEYEIRRAILEDGRHDGIIML